MSFFKNKKATFSRFFFEVAIIIVGILLSLMISNWVQNRKDNKKEADFLRQIKLDLEEDLNTLENDLAFRESQLNFAASTLQIINTEGEEISIADFSGGIQKLLSTIAFVPNNTTFKSMESTGQLQLIDNPKLVEALMDLYTNYYGAIELNNNDVTLYRNNLVVPYIIENIDMNGAMFRQDPGDISKVLTDRTFTNHLLYNQISLFSTQGAYQVATEKVQELLEMVNKEL